jgi:peptidoglycan/LPS O-acetylase OafA/YrhL
MGKAPDIPALTGVRFIAAATIVWAHFAESSEFSLFGLRSPISVIGMPLFFTLSGFIVHYVYAAPFAKNWRSAVPAFAMARFSRLYPLFFALLLFYLLGRLGRMFYAHPGIGLSFASLTGTWWYWVADGQSLASQRYHISWSISTEMFFYLIYALGLYRIAGLSDVRRCVLLLAGMCVLTFAALYGVFVTQDSWQAFVLARHPDYISTDVDMNDSFYRWLLYLSPYFHLPEFIAGVLTCQIYLLVQRRGSAFRAGAGEALAWTGVAWLLAALALLVARWDFDLPGQFLSFVVFLHMNFLMAPGCSLLILALALGGCSLARVLGHRVPTYLGEVSYSIYLGHPFVFTFMFLIGFGAPAYVMTLGFVLVAAWASLLYFAIERPGKAWLRAAFGNLSGLATPRPAAKTAEVEDAAARVVAGS